MKKTLVALAVVALALVAAGCSLDKTYHYEMSFGTMGTCIELSTNDKATQDAAIQASYTEGPCSSDYTASQGCEYTSTYGTKQATVTAYYKGYSDSLLAAACSASGGVLK